MKLAYSLWGAGSEKKLIFLHGMGGTGTLWRPIAAALEEEFAILAPDQRGHGGSQVPHIPGGRTPARYTPLDYGQDIVETVEDLGFHPAFVIGHSMGVRTACAFAHLKPDWVSGLVLIDLGFSGPAGGGLGDGLAQFLKILPMEFESRQKARDFMTSHCPDASIGQYLMAVSHRDPSGRIRFPFDRAALIETIESTRDVSVRNWIADTARRGKPVLVLRGAESKVWLREEFDAEKRALAEFPHVIFKEFAGAGHGLPFEKRAEFVAELRGFVAG